ncbi:hypothetical protein SRHO_G00307850 [Serrasalmus rhombeus]
MPEVGSGILSQPPQAILPVTSWTEEAYRQKKRVFMAVDREELKRVQKEPKTSIKKGKEEYKSKLENKLELNDTCDVWRGLKDVTGFNHRSPIPAEGKSE